jgi:hypothetical protein
MQLQKFREQATFDLCDNIHSFSSSKPHIVAALVNVEQSSKAAEVVERREAVRDHFQMQLDTSIRKVLEKKKRNQKQNDS